MKIILRKQRARTSSDSAFVGDQPSTAWALTRPATNRTEQQ